MATLLEYLSATALVIAIALILVVTGTLVTAFFVAIIVVLIIGVILEGLSSLSTRNEVTSAEEEEERDG